MNHSDFAAFDQEETVDFKAFVKKLINHWYIFLISIIVFAVIAFIYTRYSTPAYKINAKILIEDEKKGGGGSSAGELLGDMGIMNIKSTVDNELEIIKTREMALKVVKKMNLHISYYRKGTVKNKKIFKAPFRIEILSLNDSVKNEKFKLVTIKNGAVRISTESDAENFTVRFGEPIAIAGVGVIVIIREPEIQFESSEYGFVITSLANAVTSFKKNFSASVTNKLVTTIDMSFNCPIPKMGEEILTNFIEGYMEQNLIDKNRIVDSTIAFIENRLFYVGKELGDIEGNIQSFKQMNQIANISEKSKTLISSSSDYTKELSELETQLRIVKDWEIRLKDKKNNGKGISNASLPQDAVFSRLVENYNTLLLEREKLLLSSTEDNPFIKNLDDRIASLRDAMLSSLAGSKRSTEIALEQLAKKINVINGEIMSVPEHERTFLGMFRQQTLKQELYLYLLKKREEIVLSKSSNISTAKLIDPPKSESKPSGPNNLVILAICLLAGLAFPIGIVYVKDALNDKIQTRTDILKAVEIPILGEIGSTKATISNPQSVMSEQFRALRTNLHFFTNNVGNMTILLTSSMKSEGKIFSALNLGSILAISGKKTLLLDLDLRVGGITNKLQMTSKLGFTNYINTPEMEISEIILPSGIQNGFFVIPTGISLANPSEILMNEKVELLINKLKNEFDYIIINSPPIGLVTDTYLLTKYASVTLYVVRQNFTLKSQLEIPQRLYANKMIEKIGILFNDIKVEGKRAYRYGEYGSSNMPKTIWGKLFG
jgi:tyrosine-protein kinase Etk/Wzc